MAADCSTEPFAAVNSRLFEGWNDARCRPCSRRTRPADSGGLVLDRAGRWTENKGVLKTIFICKMSRQLPLWVLLCLGLSTGRRRPRRRGRHVPRSEWRRSSTTSRRTIPGGEGGQVIEARSTPSSELIAAARKLFAGAGSDGSLAAGDRSAGPARSKPSSARSRPRRSGRGAAFCRVVRATLKRDFAPQMVPAAAVDAEAARRSTESSARPVTVQAGEPRYAGGGGLPSGLRFTTELAWKSRPALAFHAPDLWHSRDGDGGLDTLPAQDRWHLAFYVVGLRHGTAGSTTGWQ